MEQQNGTSIGIAPFVERLSRLVRSRFHRKLEVLPIIGIDSTQDQILVKGDDIHIPLRYGNVRLGKAILKALSPFEHFEPFTHEASSEPDLIEQASQTVRLALEPILYKDYLDRTESNLKGQIFNRQSKSENVRHFPFAQPEDSFSTPPQKGLTHFIILLNSQNMDLTLKVAQELHEQSENWTFVQYQDLKSTTQNVSDLEELGRATLFFRQSDLSEFNYIEWIDRLGKRISEGNYQGPLFIIQVSNENDLLKQDLNLPLTILPIDKLPNHRILRIEAIQMLLRKSYQS